MTLEFMLHHQEYNQKPSDYEVGGIVNDMKHSTGNLDELIKAISSGRSFRPAVLDGTKAKDFISQQIIGIDFDGGMRLFEAETVAYNIGLPPTFIYTTFSHNPPEDERFRFVYVMDQPVDDPEVMKDLFDYFKSVYPASDPSGYSLSRFFYGGDIEKVNGNIINVHELWTKKAGIHSNDCGRGQEVISYTHNKYLSNTNYVGSKLPDTIKSVGNRGTQTIKTGKTLQKIIFSNQAEFMEYLIKEINLAEVVSEYLGYTVAVGEKFNCLFHQEKKPSAAVFRNNKGDYIYKCHSSHCGTAVNIIGFMEKKEGYRSRPQTFKELKKKFNLDVQLTEWQKEQHEIIDSNIRTMLDGEFKNQCPTAYKNISRNSQHILRMFYIAKDNIRSEEYTDPETGNVIFFASKNFIGEGRSYTRNIPDKLALFEYHELIRKIPEDELKDSIRKKAEKHRKEKSLDSENKIDIINHFSIPSYTQNHLEAIEEQAKHWRENGYTMQGCSREMFLRTEGEKVADQLYPNHVGRAIDQNNQAKAERVAATINKMIQSKGFALEKDLIKKLKRTSEFKGLKTKSIQSFIKKVMSEILQSYSLERVKTNQAIKEKYKIESKGYPIIIKKGVQDDGQRTKHRGKSKDHEKGIHEKVEKGKP